MPRPSLKPPSQQIIVITGATCSNGLASARMAAERGAAVVLAADNEVALRRLVEEIRGLGARAENQIAGVADPAQVDAIAAKAVDAFGGFDSSVNGAGAFIYGRMGDVSFADQRRLFVAQRFQEQPVVAQQFCANRGACECRSHARRTSRGVS